MKIKDVKQAQSINDLKIEENHYYFFIGNSRKEQSNKMRAFGIPEKQIRCLVFMTPLQGLANWSLVVFDGYDPQQLAQALNYNPKQVFNALTSTEDNGTSEGNITTPLEKAVTHLLRIGSTNRAELELMARHFITEKGACEKLGITYWVFAKGKIKDTLNAFRMAGQSKFLLKISQEFFDSSEYKNLQLLGHYFGCEVVIDSTVTDYFIEGVGDVSIQ